MKIELNLLTVLFIFKVDLKALNVSPYNISALTNMYKCHDLFHYPIYVVSNFKIGDKLSKCNVWHCVPMYIMMVASFLTSTLAPFSTT